VTANGDNVVAAVSAHHLCCGCGTCVAVCPTGALSMRETPAGFLVASIADEGLCAHCGLCRRVCPGAQLTDQRESTLDRLEDPFLGEVRAAYWGWAEAAETRWNGASGGVVTALLRHLMQSGAVEAALVTRWSASDPLTQEAFVALEPDDLVHSQKSRYCPVALNEALRQLSSSAHVAIVGLPCHLHGIERARPLLSEALPEITTIGLFCERVLSRLMIDRLIGVSGVAEPVGQFHYKHKGQHGWPGDVFVQRLGAEAVFLAPDARHRRKDLYTPVRCRLCFDKLNVLADISCGDGYGAPYAAEGVSAVLVRTERGEEAITSAGDALHLVPAPVPNILREHRPEERKRSCTAYAEAFARMCPNAPNVLPHSCLHETGPPDRREVDRCRHSLQYGLRFEGARDPEAAARIARTEERRQQLRMLPMRVRPAVIRAVKWSLRRFPGGRRILGRRGGE